MPIPVSCQCGYQVDAPDHYAGQQVNCPQCSNPLTVPAAAPAAANTGLGGALEGLGIKAGSGGIPCPHCLDAEIPVGGIICIACGYNVETGSLMGGDEKKQKKAFGAATYTHRSYGNEQLNHAAQMMEKELLEINAEGGLPYWFWLFVFFNVISFGLGLAMFSLTWFSLSGETLKIATMRGDGVTAIEDVAEAQPEFKDNINLIVSEVEISNTASKPKKDDSDTGTTMTQKAKPGTYGWREQEQNGFIKFLPLPDQTQAFDVPGGNGNGAYFKKKKSGWVLELSGEEMGKAGWVPSSSVVNISPSQLELIILGNQTDLARELRPVTDEAYYALYKGLGSYCTIEFYIGLVYYVVCHISIATWAFKDNDKTQAFLASAIPGYNMIWAFMRRKYVGGLGIMAILAFTMIFGSLIVESFVPELLPTVAGASD